MSPTTTTTTIIPAADATSSPPLFFLPETTDPSEQKSRHMATGHGRLDSQMHCACVCKTLRELHYTGKPAGKRMGLCVCMCVCVDVRETDRRT